MTRGFERRNVAFCSYCGGSGCMRCYGTGDDHSGQYDKIEEDPKEWKEEIDEA